MCYAHVPSECLRDNSADGHNSYTRTYSYRTKLSVITLNCPLDSFSWTHSSITFNFYSAIRINLSRIVWFAHLSRQHLKLHSTVARTLNYFFFSPFFCFYVCETTLTMIFFFSYAFHLCSRFLLSSHSRLTGSCSSCCYEWIICVRVDVEYRMFTATFM